MPFVDLSGRGNSVGEAIRETVTSDLRAVPGLRVVERARLDEVLGWARDKTLVPIIAARRPLEEAQAAQAALKEKGVIGRQLLIP